MGHIHCQQNFFTLGKSCSFITVYYRTVAAHVTTHDVCVYDSKHQIVLQFSIRHANVHQLQRNVFQDLFAARCRCIVWRRFTVIIISGLFKSIMMWHALEIPCVFSYCVCVELQCVQCMTLYEVFHFIVVTSLLATLRKKHNHGHLLYLYPHFAAQPSLLSGMAISAILWDPLWQWHFLFHRKIMHTYSSMLLRYKVRASCS